MTYLKNFFDPFDILFRNMLLENATYKPFENFDYPADVYADDVGLHFELAVVDINLDNIEITTDMDTLKIVYHSNEESPPSDRNYIVRKIAKRDFEYSWRISKKFDLNNIMSTYKNGLLKIDIPVTEQAVLKKVDIKLLG